MREPSENSVVARADELTEAIRDKLDEVKPRLRGWLHAASVPLALGAGAVLVALSPTATTRVGSAVYMGSALLLFTVSAVYHRGRWSPRTWAVLRRLDHASIFVLIAGSYTPFTLLLLEGPARVSLLVVAWAGAVIGVLFRLLWWEAPRWVYIPIYTGLGWAAVFFAGQFWTAATTSVLTLMIVGGLLYTLGAVVYGLKRPDPFPSWFGFHEVFHTLTVAAFAAHYAGVLLATSSVR